MGRRNGEKKWGVERKYREKKWEEETGIRNVEKEQGEEWAIARRNGRRYRTRKGDKKWGVERKYGEKKIGMRKKWGGGMGRRNGKIALRVIGWKGA